MFHEVFEEVCGVVFEDGGGGLEGCSVEQAQSVLDQPVKGGRTQWYIRVGQWI